MLDTYMSSVDDGHADADGGVSQSSLSACRVFACGRWLPLTMLRARLLPVTVVMMITEGRAFLTVASKNRRMADAARGARLYGGWDAS
jgi:hypothetical protein